MYHEKRKGAPGSVMELTLVLEEIKGIKKSGVKWNKEGGDSKDPNLLSFQLVKRNERKT